MTKTKNAYEKFLNDYYTHWADLDDAIDALVYLISKKWCMKIAKRKIWQIIINGRAGSVLRLRDPIAFNEGYDKWNP